MSAEIHKLSNAGPLLEPDKTVIAELKELLVEAEAGRVKGFGSFIVCADGTMLTSFISGSATCTEVVAGAARLSYRVMKTLD